MTGAEPPPVAIITGGGSGIGRACAAALVSRGMHCVLVGRQPHRLQAAGAELDGPATVIAADLTKPGESERIVEETLAAHGRIDVIVHSAGVFEKALAPEVTRDHWQRVLDINLGAVIALTSAAWRALATSEGQIVLISSIAAVQAFEGNAAYAASKGGLNALGEVLRLEGRDQGIRVITVCPAQTDTELWTAKAPDSVRARMMPADGVGELVASLVGTDRRIDISPVVIRPVRDPWAETEPGAPSDPEPGRGHEHRATPSRGADMSTQPIALGLQIVPTMDSAELVETIVLAEELGYSYCMVADEGLMLDVYAVLGAAARTTSTIRLGAVTNPYTRHPAATAAAIATIDEMSGGRAFVTLVAGGTMVLHPMGLVRSAPLALMADTITALRLLWRGAPVTWQGRRLSLEGAQLTTGTHSIPVWVAARGEKMLALAGTQGDGLVLMVKSDLGDAFSIAEQARQAARAEPGAERAGSPLTRVYLDRLAYKPEMVEEAKHLYGYAIMDSPPRILKNLGLSEGEIAGLKHAFEQGGPEAVGQLVTDDLVAEYQIAGTPEECRSQLQQLIGAHRLDAFFVNIISPGLAANRELLTTVVSIANGS